MNIEQAKKHIHTAIDTLVSQYSHTAVYNDICYKYLIMALNELESPVSTKKSNGYCSKCYWPTAQCKCNPWPEWRKQSPGFILAEDMLVEVTPGPRTSGFARSVPDRVSVTHKPTGVSISYSTERSQHANKQRAWNKVVRELKNRGWNDGTLYPYEQN